MRFAVAVDLYLSDMVSEGRITSDATVRRYRGVLDAHAEDVSNRDPALTGRDDVKRTLRRWPKANTQRVCRSTLVSFYDWMVEEGYRPHNPARQTRRPKKQPTDVYRLTGSEVRAMLACCQGPLEERAIRLGVCAGLRSAELRGLQGQHFAREGFIRVSADIAKGGKERWVPVIVDLQPTVDDIRRDVKADEFVLPAQRWRDPGVNTERTSLNKRPMSAQALYYLVGRVGSRAGIEAHVHPHLMRHAYGDHIAKQAGLLVAQAVMGHASVETTRSTYVDHMSLDELTAGVEGVTYKKQDELSPDEQAHMGRKAPTRFELVDTASRPFTQDFGLRLVELRKAFEGVSFDGVAA